MNNCTVTVLVHTGLYVRSYEYLHPWSMWCIFHHDDVIKWNIFALLAFCVGNSPVTGEFPSQRPVTRSFDVFFDLCLNQQMSKLYGDAGNLRRHRAHYDITVMWSLHSHCMNTALIQCQCRWKDPHWGTWVNVVSKINHTDKTQPVCRIGGMYCVSKTSGIPTKHVDLKCNHDICGVRCGELQRSFKSSVL